MKIITPTEQIQTVDTDKAMSWLADFNYRHQRDIRRFHVDALARMMSSGQFRQKTQVNFISYAGTYYLTNGQHTLAAIVKSGLPQTLSVIVNEASSEEEIADDFSRHDTHLTRRFADALVAHECDRELGVTRTQLQWIVAAAQYFAYLTGEATSKSSVQSTHDEKLILVRRHGELGCQALARLDGFQSLTWLTRKTTLAMIMVCEQFQPELSEQFWPIIASDDGLRVGDARKTLREYLRTSTTGGGAGVHSRSKLLTDHELVKGIAVAWDAWLRDYPLKLIKINRDATIVDLTRCRVLRVKGTADDAFHQNKTTKPDRFSRIHPVDQRAER